MLDRNFLLQVLQMLLQFCSSVSYLINVGQHCAMSVSPWREVWWQRDLVSPGRAVWQNGSAAVACDGSGIPAKREVQGEAQEPLGREGRSQM